MLVELSWFCHSVSRLDHESAAAVMLRVHGTRYPSFLSTEIMPYIGDQYRVATGVENTGFGGSSLGALIALYTAQVCPGLIGRLLLESPSLWASNRQLVRHSRNVRHWPERVFLAIGTNEGGRADTR